MFKLTSGAPVMDTGALLPEGGALPAEGPTGRAGRVLGGWDVGADGVTVSAVEAGIVTGAWPGGTGRYTPCRGRPVGAGALVTPGVGAAFDEAALDPRCTEAPPAADG